MFDWFDDFYRGLVNAGAWRLEWRILSLTVVEEGLQYAAAATSIWLLLHVLFKRYFANRLISKWPKTVDLWREVSYSLSTIIVLAGCNVLVVALGITKHIDVYTDPLQHGVVWLVLSLPALIIWQDIHFYWTHRLLHTPWLFRHVHSVHHRSRQPSPFAAFSFHPIEALNNNAFLLVALLLVPMNEMVLGVFLLFQVIRTAYGHAAVETMPSGFARNAFWGRFTTTTHHHLHHEVPQGNFGLWFTWWDRLCETEHATYLPRFDDVTQRKADFHEAPEQKLTLGK